MSTGWVKLHRKLLDSRVFAKPELLKLWILCLCQANHKETWVDIEESVEPIKLNRGEFITGRYSLHGLYYPRKKKNNKSPLTLWRWLQKLEKWGKLNIKTYNKFSVVEVVNYDYYQYSESGEQEDEQQVNNRRTTGEQQVNTDKNEKNEKNEKKTTTRGASSGKDEEKEKSESEKIAERVSTYLLEAIKEYDPTHKYHKNPPAMGGWIKELDRAIRLDGRTEEQLKFVIDFIFKENTDVGSFWSANIQSGKKLRDKFDQLKLKIKKELKHRKNGNYSQPKSRADREIEFQENITRRGSGNPL